MRRRPLRVPHSLESFAFVNAFVEDEFHTPPPSLGGSTSVTSARVVGVDRADAPGHADRSHRPPQLQSDRSGFVDAYIQLDTQCLPIFIAGSDILYYLCGSTSTSRLRCSLESFAYVNMFVEDVFRSTTTFDSIGA